MSEDVEVPTTDGEKRIARAAFVAGSVYQCGWTSAEAVAEARRRYPILRRVPRVVTLDPRFGTTASLGEDGYLRFHEATGEYGSKTMLSPVAVAVLRDILANPFDIVEE